jgi:glutathione S-transferase
VPPFAQGYVRDLRVRWALEEAGLPYEAELIDVMAKPAGYTARQPFNQVPAFRDGEVDMFESGAIVLYLAGKSTALAPAGEAGRARVTAWVVAALNSIEPHAQNFIQLAGSVPEDVRGRLDAMIDGRLKALDGWLGDADYLEGDFSAGDLMMAAVIRELVDCGMLGRFPRLDAYRRRCEARPAFERAMAAQMAPFAGNAPG